MALFTVKFTSQVLVKKIGPKNKIISESRLDKPVTITALPYETAMSYSGCDNFTIEPYVMEQRRSSNSSGRDNSVGNGTKKVSHMRGETNFSRGAVNVATGSGQSKIANAATTGNMAAALNA